VLEVVAVAGTGVALARSSGGGSSLAYNCSVEVSAGTASSDVFYYCFGLATQGVSFLVNPNTGSWKYGSTA
jgi:hypothetical protein